MSSESDVSSTYHSEGEIPCCLENTDSSSDSEDSSNYYQGTQRFPNEVFSKEDRQHVSAALNNILKDGVHFYPRNAEYHLKTKYPSIYKQLRLIHEGRGCLIFICSSLLKCLNIRISQHVPRNVLFDVCIFNQYKPMMVLTFAQQTTNSVSQYNLIIAKSVKIHVNSNVSEEFTCVHGVVDKDHCQSDVVFLKRMEELLNNAKQFAVPFSLYMDQAKCRDSIQSFLTLIPEVKQIARDPDQADDSQKRLSGAKNTSKVLEGMNLMTVPPETKHCKVSIFHVKDVGPWCKYLSDLFTKVKGIKVKSIDLDEMDSEKPPQVAMTIRESYLIVLLASPDMLTYMKDKVWLSETLRQVPDGITVVVALCFVDRAEFQESVGDSYKASLWWKHYVVSHDQRENMSNVEDMLDIAEKNALPLSRAVKPRRRRTDIAVQLRVIPSRVHAPHCDVVLAFKDEVKGTIQVSLTDAQRSSSVPKETPTKHNTRKLNSYTHKFKAPEKAPGTYVLHVFNDAKEIYTALFYYVSHHETSFKSVEYLCQSFQCENMVALDRKLADILEHTLPEDDSLSGLFCKLKVNLPPGVTRSKFEYPTLLHFAAASGLCDFCSILLDVPGSHLAYHMENYDGKDPADLADLYNHPELAQYIRDFMATFYLADACDRYVAMTGRYQSVQNPEIETEVRLPNTAMDSTSQNDLLEVMKAVKEGIFNPIDTSMFLKSWRGRNSDGQTKSLKERQKTLKKIRDDYSAMINNVEKQADQMAKIKPNFLSRVISMRKRSTRRVLHISNPIVYWGRQILPSYTQDDRRFSKTSTASSLSVSSEESSPSSSGVSSIGSISSMSNDPYSSGDDIERQVRKLDFLEEVDDMEEGQLLLPPRTYSQSDVLRPVPRPRPRRLMPQPRTFVKRQ